MSWMMKSTVWATRNSASRGRAPCSRRSRISDSTDAATKNMPRIATMIAGQATPMPGMRTNSETASALENEVSAAEARTRCTWLSPSLASRSCVTETATKSRPTSAPATPAAATKKSWNWSGSTARVGERRRAG